MKYGYRSENIYGEGFRDAGDVISHEIFELGNTDILHYLYDNGFKNPSYKNLWNAIELGDEDALIKVIHFPGQEREWVKDNILFPIYKRTGLTVNYVLWLCDSKEDVENSYQVDAGDQDIDTYPVGEVLLSDLGKEGKLYGYEFLPERIPEDVEMERF